MRNIVLLTYDSLRADHCGHHGYDRDTTSNLDNLAEQGVSFNNAASTASRTNPSMAGTFTGEPMVFRGNVSNPDISRSHLSRYETLAEQLSEIGYTTAAFCPNAYASRHFGFDRGFDHFEDFLFSSDTYQSIFQEHLEESEVYGTIRNLRNFVRREEVFRTWDQYIDDIETWVERQDGPYFIWVFSMDTHFPFLTPRGERTFSNTFDQYYYNWQCNRVIDKVNPELSNRTLQKMVDIYDDAIRYGDMLIPELQDRLKNDDPTFFVHSDHGEAFGEHEMFGHFYPAFYEENVHVPLVAWNKGSDSSVVEEPFSLLDIPEYVVDVAQGGDISDPPTRKIAPMSDYDGHRGRNLIGMRTENQKFILQSSEDGDREEFFELTSREDGEASEQQVKDGPEILRQFAARRDQHEKEVLAVRRAVAQNRKRLVGEDR